MLAQNRAQDHYNFSAEPRVVNHRAKYREYPVEEPQQALASNIMWDRRVVRGNTYAAIVTTTRDIAQQMQSSQPRLKNTLNQALETGEIHADRADVSTPKAVEGRCHINIGTDENVELLTDKPPNYEKDTQTDFYIERPLNRLYMPVKTGDDRETQIWDGELFDFDHEVEPILQVLIGKALEQGRMEVLEEEELRTMKAEQKRFDDLRDAEIAEAQRMEAEERRRMEENERRKRQHALKKEQSVTSHKKILSRAFAKEFLKNVRGDTFVSLEAQGTFQDHMSFELNHTVLPWFFKDIMELCQGNNAVVNTIKNITATLTQNLGDIHQKSVLAEQERRRLAKEERERLAREKEERRTLRAEARKKRAEEERRRVLTEKINEVLLSKAEQKTGIFTQTLSDMDSFGKEGMTVGLIGGVIGEILLVLSTIDDIKKAEESDPLYSLKNIQISKDTVQKVVDYIMSDKVADGKIEIGVSEDIDAQLEAIEAGLTLEAIHTMPNKAAEIKKVLNSSINSFVLKSIQEASEKLAIKFEYVEMIKQALVNAALSATEEERKIKLVKTPLDYSAETRLEAIAVLMPNLEEMPLFNLIEAKGVKPTKKGKANVEVPEPEEPVAPTSAEIDYEDLVSVFPLQSEELRVLVNHKPASIVFRRDVLMFMSTIYKELDMKEIEVLKRVNQKADAVEEVIANKFEKNLTVLVFDRV